MADRASSSSSSSSSMKKRPSRLSKKPFVDPKMKRVITDNLRQVLSKLGNIADAVVKRNIELKGENAPEPPVVDALKKASEAFKKLEDL